MSLLEVRGVTKRCGGLTANKDGSFDVGPGELVGVIGPNGAGKSTLFDLITGFLTPDAGDGRLARRAGPRPRPPRLGRAGRAGAHARALPPGQRKRLDLARALATEPRLLLLDEVTGGVDQATVPALVRLVRDLHARGLALLVIEHNMRVIMELAERVVALHLVEVIADGAPAEIVRNRRVIDAYLG